MSLAPTGKEPASPAGGDVRARSAAHGDRRVLSSARLVLDVIASSGGRDMRLSELARRMHLRGHSQVETSELIVTLLDRGLLTSDETTLLLTDIGWGVASRRTPSNRVRA